ncbi:MAG: R3H domain protein [Deltaproteobacteria bacterium ADurb.Bin510]|nr:MAG: R3H domain protein [Deltaproteobacteria bacterium ADurb.Bin510]
MEKKDFEAKSVDEAIVVAMKTLRASFEELEIDVIQEGSKGLFGIGAKPARIRVGLKQAEAAKPAAAKEAEPRAAAPAKPVQAPAPASQPDQTEADDEPVSFTDDGGEASGNLSDEILAEAKTVLQELLRCMDMQDTVEITNARTLNIVGDGSGILIGKRGQTLDALQFILNRILNKSRDEQIYVNIDTEGYRERHVSQLASMAVRMAAKAKKGGRPVSLERMNPHDRRIIHLALKDDESVTTKSVGDGSFKKVVIVPRKASKA